MYICIQFRKLGKVLNMDIWKVCKINRNVSFVFSSEAGSEPKSMRENIYDTLPRSLKSDLLVRVRDEDPELQRQRQELTR
jgi:hypothetical protein